MGGHRPRDLLAVGVTVEAQVDLEGVARMDGFAAELPSFVHAQIMTAVRSRNSNKPIYGGGGIRTLGAP